jgi:hypothetical protein
VKIHFAIVGDWQGWQWSLMRSRGRGKLRERICGSKVYATEDECRASIAEFVAAVARAKVEREKP